MTMLAERKSCPACFKSVGADDSPTVWIEDEEDRGDLLHPDYYLATGYWFCRLCCFRWEDEEWVTGYGANI